MIISLDTETTGLDLYHGARPFLVTTANERGENLWWEWYVDPMTRKVKVREQDLDEIQEMINSADELILQNCKFDYMGLSLLFSDHGHELEWEWGKVRDTLLAGHLLASNQPHDLTSMAMIYCRANVQPYEDVVRQATQECRRLCQGKNPKHRWKIARKGLPGMPSAKETTWKHDMWLPRYVAKLEARPKDDWYWTACSEYANSDSTITLGVWKAQRKAIEKRGLRKIYDERLKVLPVIPAMERHGVTVHGPTLHRQKKECAVESARASAICKTLASGYGHNLSLPKSGNNKSLIIFCFDAKCLALEPYERSAKTGAPSLSKRCLEYYLITLPSRSKARMFLHQLAGKRKQDTLISFADGYEKFWVPTHDPHWFLLHPSLNPTGTDTLRWSSSNPNEQNISKQADYNLRRSFGPMPRREWWALDAKNIELRLPAYESGEVELIDLFEHPNDPPYYGSTHLLNFHTVYSDIWEKELRVVGPKKVGLHCKEKYDSTWYKWVKNGGFAVQYGAMERTDVVGTADKAFRREGSHAKLKARFARLERLNQYWIDYANEHGYVETIPDRTIDPERGYPLLCSRSKWGKVLPTVPLNYHVQSSAMWWMMKAMIRCYGFLEEYNDGRPEAEKVHIVMQVHDELVFDLPNRKAKGNLPIVRKLQRLMEQGGDDYGIPTPVDVKYHPVNWAEAV